MAIVMYTFPLCAAVNWNWLPLILLGVAFFTSLGWYLADSSYEDRKRARAMRDWNARQ